MRGDDRHSMAKLLDFLDRLEQSHISYRLEHVRESILVSIAVPGERWEVEFFDDGHIETEIFRSPGEITRDEALLDRLIAEHGS